MVGHRKKYNRIWRKSLCQGDVCGIFYGMRTEDFAKAATGLLEQCEHGLQKLLAEAVAARDYDAVMRLTSMAKVIREMACGANTARPVSEAEPASPDSRTAEVVAKARTSSRKASLDYPRFMRRGDRLVKIGWSKRKKGTYQHRIPRKFLDATVAAVKQAGAEGKVFGIDSFLPVTDPRDGAPIPDYLVYVGLAWLKQIGLVDQHGRQGYSVPKIEILTETVEAAWQQLPKG